MQHASDMPNEDMPLASQKLASLLERAGLRGDAATQAFGYKTRSGMQNYTQDYENKFFPEKFVKRAAAALYGKGNPPITVNDLVQLLGDYPAAENSVQESTFYHMLSLEPPERVRAMGQVSMAKGLVMPVTGDAHASFWMPRAPSFDEPTTWLAIPFGAPEDAGDNRYALKILGPSLNRVALEGDYAICRRFWAQPRDLDQDEIVHAERRTELGIEWTLKRVRYKGGKCLLCPDSDHPDHQEPLAYSPDGADATVTILGIVSGFYRPVR